MLATMNPQEVNILDVREFGATGDGGTNDRDYFNAAMQASAAMRSPAVVVVPPGIYRFAAGINIIRPLQLLPGAILTMDRGHILSFSATPQLPEGVQCFGNETVVRFLQGTAMRSCQPAWWGAKTSNSSPSATQVLLNTQAIRQAWNAASANTGGTGASELRFSAGRLYTKKIGPCVASFTDPLTQWANLNGVNICGGGMKQSYVALANNENTGLFDNSMTGGQIHDCNIHDVGFFGNKANQSSLGGDAALVVFDGYNMAIEQVWVRESISHGLQIQNLQHYTLLHIDTEIHDGIGCIVKDVNGISLIDICSEQNAGGGMLIYATTGSGMQSGIKIINPYFESNTGFDLEIRGLSCVEVFLGSCTTTAGVKTVKLTKDATTGKYARGNIIFAGSTSNKIQIDLGCYGNSIIESSQNPNDNAYVEDADGRNYVGALTIPGTAVPVMNAYLGVTSHLDNTNAADGTASAIAPSTWTRVAGSLLHPVAAHNTTFGGPCHYELISNTGSPNLTFGTVPANLALSSTFYLYLLAEIPHAYMVTVQLLDTNTNFFYDFATATWISTATGNFVLATNGQAYLHRLKFVTDGTARKPQVKVILGRGSDLKARFFYANITDKELSGLIHRRGGATIGYGDQLFLATAALPTAAQIPDGTQVFDITTSLPTTQYGGAWL